MFYHQKAIFLVSIYLLIEVTAFPKPKTRNSNDINQKLKLNSDSITEFFRYKRNLKYVYNNEFSSGSDVGKKNPVLSTNEPLKVNQPVVNDLFSQSSSKSLQIKLHHGDSELVNSGKKPDMAKDAAAAAMFKASLLEKATAIAKQGSARICIHTYNSVAHSARVLTDGPVLRSSYDDDGIEYGDYDEREPVLSNMTIPGLGYVHVEHCAKPTDFCYAFWSQGKEPGDISILGQGCWESSDIQEACSKGACSSERPPPRARPATKFCCCRADLCNAEPLSAPPNTAIPSTEESWTPLISVDPPPHFLGGATVIGVVAAFLGALAIAALLLTLCCRLGKSAHSTLDPDMEHGNTQEAGGPGFSCSATCVDNLKLHDNIGEGRHAKVWRGSLGGVPVAVKALPSSRVALWSRERELYCLPHMGHPNLLAYLGCDTRPTLEGSSEHLLVLQLAPLGSLRQYLAAHTLHWDTYTKMALGVASALAHLHTHIDRDDQYKPCIVHRDVNSSNVVVRADLSCCLADLGLAMALPDTRRAVQQHRIQEAGTLRYLSPEALEGALDLRRCDAALRAVDVYALALVLWELLSRCGPAHSQPGAPDYAPPYHAQVGEQPTLEQMQLVVARRKARPLFSPRLINTRGARLARDTCEDCWDHDAEARLTAVCVVERLSELRNLKPAPSPTINSNDLRPPNSHDATSNSHSPSSIEDKNSNVISSANLPNGNPATIFDFQPLQPLQPHQGRNPCLERNLACAGPGDRLIDKSLKDMPSNSSSSSTNGYGTNDFIRMEQSISGSNLRNQPPQDFSRNDSNQATNVVRNSNRLYANSNTTNLINLDPIHDDIVTNEFRTIVRPVTPIGYVQNDVSNSDSNSTVANGECSHSHMVKQTNLKMEQDGTRWSARNFKRLLDSKVFKKRNRQNRPLETEVNLILANGKPINTSNGRIKTSVILNDTNGKVNRDDFRLNFGRNTDVLIVDRPSSLPGIDAVSMSEDSSALNPETWKNLQNFTDNNTCTVSPPNQTLSIANVSRLNRTDDNVVVGFKELPSGSRITNCVKNQNQVFAVIVPRSNYNGVCNDVNSKDFETADWKYRNGKALLSTLSSNVEHNKKVENRLVKANNESLDVSSSSRSDSSKLIASNSTKLISNGVAATKRHSCDEKIFSTDNKLHNADGLGSSKRNGPSNNSKCTQNRNSYSGEFEVGNFCVYNNDDGDGYDPSNMVDYSSNSEDEHMLLLSENDGSKITMRQRMDVKPNEGKYKKKSKQNLNSHHADGSLSKITAGSFTSLCNKYGPKGKYENFENESSEHLLEPSSQDPFVNSGNSLQDIRRKSSIIDRNDVSVINLVRNGSSLSLCRNDIDNTSFIDLNCKENGINSLSENTINDKINSDSIVDYINGDDYLLNKVSDSDDDDDATLRDDVFTNERIARPLSIKQNLSRQHSLELVSELFSSSADLTRRKDPADRIKTPGDVPPSVRRVRGSSSGPRIKRTSSAKEKTKTTSANRLSLYDDRMMFGNSL